MAKEMMIIFVYDTQLLQKDDEDLNSAILYFHPNWVSDKQKTALCGQIVGTIHCLKTIFSPPRIVALQSGKFFVKEYGRYLLAVGTDRNIADWLLEHRGTTLTSLVTLFHQDIELMGKIYDNSSKLSAKIYQLFETYLKFLFLSTNIFSHTPSLKLPKSASNVFLDSIHILQCCQKISSVLGGSLLYHNKVVATQLSSDLTKNLVLTDPYRIKCPAETPILNFELPLGVQLLYVYISNKEYCNLHQEAIKCRNIHQYLHRRSIRVKTKPKEQVLSAMKRDRSLIFTSVPEEDSDHTISVTKTKQNRPKFLNLRMKTTDSIESKPKILPNTTPFHGMTSVCSTPMTELNKIVHDKALSICLNPLQEPQPIKKLHEEPITSHTVKNLQELDKLVPYLNINRNIYDLKKSSSVFDLREKLKSPEKSITIKYYNLETINKYKELQDNLHVKKDLSKSLVDPTFPVLKSDGNVVSHSFYDDYISNQMQNMDLNASSNDSFDQHLVDFVKTVAPVDKIRPLIDTSKDIEMSNRQSDKEKRKSLTLPLKSFNAENPTPINAQTGVLLTPLLSKLCSFDERSSGFCSREQTPGDVTRLFTPTQTHKLAFKRSKSINEFKYTDTSNVTQKCILFVCGQQDMVVNLLLQEDICNSRESIDKLWEICTENLGKLEKQLHHCLETYPVGNLRGDSEPYSYLYLDSDWDTTQRGGPWGIAELGALTYIHRDFKQTDNLTEMAMERVRYLNLLLVVSFVVMVIVDSILTILQLQQKYSRMLQINLNYQIMFLFTCIPASFGIFYKRRELIAPYSLATVCAILMNLFQVIIILSEIDHLDGFLVFNALTSLILFFLSTFCATMAIRFFLNLSNVTLRLKMKKRRFRYGDYSLKRFEVTKV